MYELRLARRPFSELLKHLVKWLLLSVLQQMALVTWNQLGGSCLRNKIIYVFKKFGHQIAEVIMVNFYLCISSVSMLSLCSLNKTASCIIV